MYKNIIGVACACLAVISFEVSAITITYTENVDGDLSDDIQIPTNVGTVGYGLNTINGTTTFTESVMDFDSFTFIVPSGFQISSFVVEHNDRTDDLYVGASFDLLFGENVTLATIGLGTNNPENPVDVLALAGGIPLMADTYILKATNLTRWTSGGDIDYTWKIGITAVPIPSSIWLFGSGIIGLIKLARRRSRA